MLCGLDGEITLLRFLWNLQSISNNTEKDSDKDDAKLLLAIHDEKSEFYPWLTGNIDRQEVIKY